MTARLLRWLRSLFAWRYVRESIVWRYQENTVTGQRRAVRIRRGVWQPVDHDWLDAGSVPSSIIDDLGGAK
jgi:hypothetical protein